MATDSRSIYEAIATTLREEHADIIQEAMVYVVPIPIPPIGKSALAFQVVPGSPRNLHPKSGVSLVEDDFEIHIWLHSFSDESGVDTQKIIDDSWSVFEKSTRIRNAMIGDNLQGLATINVQWIRGIRPANSPDHYGWIVGGDVFRVAYQLEKR